MTLKYLSAVTPTGFPSYPPYLNFSQLEDGQVRITGRGEPAPQGASGKDIGMTFSKADFVALLKGALKELGE